MPLGPRCIQHGTEPGVKRLPKSQASSPLEQRLEHLFFALQTGPWLTNSFSSPRTQLHLPSRQIYLRFKMSRCKHLGLVSWEKKQRKKEELALILTLGKLSGKITFLCCCLQLQGLTDHYPLTEITLSQIQSGRNNETPEQNSAAVKRPIFFTFNPRGL